MAKKKAKFGGKPAPPAAFPAFTAPIVGKRK